MRGRIGLTLPGAIRPAQARDLARRAEEAGFDSVWVLDVRREPYLTAAAAITATTRAEVGTNVAVAFARSPTTTAAAAWDLSMWSGGRFVLGLGSQVGPTLEARFGVRADHPARRLADYVAAVRASFAALRDGYGKYEGNFYRIRRPALQPGSEPDVAPPPIYVAAVNPTMARVAGEYADGLAAHPFTSMKYLEEVLRPAFAEGARRAGRGAAPVLLQLVVSPDRETAARQMVAYTVPAYRRVLDHAGMGEVADRVMTASAEGKRAEAVRLIDESYLDLLGVVLESELEDGIRRWAPLADRLTLSVPWFGMKDDEQLAAAGRMVAALARSA